MQLILVLACIFIITILCWYIHVIYLEDLGHVLLTHGDFLSNPLRFMLDTIISLGIVIIPGVLFIWLGACYGFGLYSFICFVSGCVVGERVYRNRIKKLCYALEKKGFLDE